MPLDGIFLHFLKNEIEQTAIGCRVDKVHQPSKDELVLLLRSRNGVKKLLLSASANSPRIHFTEYAPENPQTPPMFCMLLRKHLTGAALTNIRQSELDRVLFLDFDCTNDIGDRVKLTLSIEIMAKHSNIILINEDNTIIDAVKRIDFTKSEVRQILPSQPYTPVPVQNKWNILNVSTELILDEVLKQKDKTLSDALLTVLQGFSPLICREISEAACRDDVKVIHLTEDMAARLGNHLNLMREMIQTGSGQAFMLKNEEEKPADFSFMDIKQYGSTLKAQQFGNFSEMLDVFYYERDRINRSRQRAADMVKVLSNATARISRKLSLQRAELSACADRETLRIHAELINANQYLLQKGALFYDVENYYDGNQVIRIPADPSLSPSANSQKYYKDYRKAKTAEQMLAALIEQGEQELQYLETVEDSLFRASTQAELDEIRVELTESGYLKQRKKVGRKTEKPLPPLEYVSVDGFKILVGRNNTQNDRLSLRLANNNDLWLHVQKMPGAHVLIVAGNKEIPPSTIEQAAGIAAYHSKGRESSLVPVDYTQVKNLKKPPGAKPGKVIYHVYNTVLVKPGL